VSRSKERVTHHPTSQNQQMLWFNALSASNICDYNIANAVRLVSRLDVSILEQAAQVLIRNHECLRTSFVVIGGQVVQRVHETVTIAVRSESFTHLDSIQLLERLQAEINHPFEIGRAPLLRLYLFSRADQEQVLALVSHVLIADDWTMRIVITELCEICNSIQRDLPRPTSNPKRRFVDFVNEEIHMLGTMQCERAWTYWKRQLSGEYQGINLPYDRPKLRSGRPAVSSKMFELNSHALRQVLELTKTTEVSLYVFMLTILKVLLYRYSGQSDIRVGTLANCRVIPDDMRVVGSFLNPIVLCATLSGELTFRDVLSQVHQIVQNASKYHKLPYAWIMEQLRSHGLSESPMVSVMFTFFDAQTVTLTTNQRSEPLVLNLPTPSPTAIDGSYEFETCYTGVWDCDLNLSIKLDRERLRGVINYDTSLFDESTIETMIQYIRTLISSVIDNADRKISAFQFRTPNDQLRSSARMRMDWGRTDFVPFPKSALNQTIHSRFEQQVEMYGTNLAIKTKNCNWTYQLLNEQANRVAYHILRHSNMARGNIGLLFGQNAPMVAALLGVLKSGNAYVPLEPSHPEPRIAHILENSCADALLVDESNLHLANRLSQGNIPVYCFEQIEDIGGSGNPNIAVDPSDLAYILYTSGSTGWPKGVMQSHRSILHFIRNYTNGLHLDSADRLTLFPSYSLAAAVMDIFGALFNGACVYPFSIRDEGWEALARWLVSENITVYHSSASVFRNFANGVSEYHRFPNLRVIDLGGEPSYRSDVDLYKRKFSSQCILVNGFGTTESTVAIQFHMNKRTRLQGELVPVGYPVDDTEVFLLNDAGDISLTPVGEIAIRSQYAALGYWKLADQTHSTFIRLEDGSNAPTYRSGDLGRINTDGAIEHLGRRDFQVKVRGYRVEVSEVEMVLLMIPWIEQAIVMAWDEVGQSRLCAYLTLNRAEAPPQSISETVRARLAERLPSYMIPSDYIVVEQMPVTPSGKIDRKSLPKPQGPRREHALAVAPQTQLEKMLASIWSKVLGVTPIGIHDNFFTLGGDSILSLQVLHQAHQAGLHFTAQQFYDHQTISEIVSVVGKIVTSPGEDRAIVGQVPMMPNQAAHTYRLDKQLVEPLWVKMTVLLEMQQKVNPAALRSAVAALLEHHDVMRSHFTKATDEWQWWIADKIASPPFTCVDLSSIAAEQQLAAIEEARSAAIEAMNYSKHPLIDFILFDRGPQVADRLLIVVHHLIFDLVSWRILLEDLEMSYHQILSSGKAFLPSKTTSILDWAAKMKAYSRTFNPSFAEKYWLSDRWSAIKPLPRDYPDGSASLESGHSLFTRLTKQETEQLIRDVTLQYSARIDEILVSGLTLALKNWTGTSVPILVSNHGRAAVGADVDLSRTIGWLTLHFPLLVDLPNDCEPQEALEATKAEVRCLPNRGIDYYALQLTGDPEINRRLGKIPPYVEVFLNFQGQYDHVFSGLRLVKRLPTPVGPLRDEGGILDITGRVIGGRLELEWAYNQNLHKHSTIQKIADSFMAALRRLVLSTRPAS